MRYYKQIKDNILLAIGTGPGGIEITETEYSALLSEIQEKANMVGQLYNGEITLEAVPEEWREEILRQVEERRKAEAEAGEEEISNAELAGMMEAIL